MDAIVWHSTMDATRSYTRKPYCSLRQKPGKMAFCINHIPPPVLLNVFCKLHSTLCDQSPTVTFQDEQDHVLQRSLVAQVSASIPQAIPVLCGCPPPLLTVSTLGLSHVPSRQDPKPFDMFRYHTSADTKSSQSSGTSPTTLASPGSCAF